EKDAGAERINKMAGAIHGAAEELGREVPGAAGYVHAAASRLQKGADALRENDIGDLVSGFDELGHKQPLTVFGTAFLAGFAITRFLKSSRTTANRGEQR